VAWPNRSNCVASANGRSASRHRSADPNSEHEFLRKTA